MAQVKISQLPANTTPAGSEQLVISNGGVSQSITVDTLSTYAGFSNVSTNASEINFNPLAGSIIVPNILDYYVYETRFDTDGGIKVVNVNNSSSIGSLKSKTILVLSAVSLTLTDISSPLLSVIHNWSLIGAKTVSAKNGVIAIVTASGLITINLITDEVFIHDNVNKRKSNQTAATFNQSTSVWTTINTTDILPSATINDSSVSTSKSSALDPQTGIIKETIITGTTNGATIFDNNSAFNLTGAVNILFTDMNESGIIVLASSTDVYIFNSIPTANAPLTTASIILNSASTPSITGTITGVLIYENSIFISTSTGVHTISYNVAAPTSSSVLTASLVPSTRIKLNKSNVIVYSYTASGMINIQNDVILDSGVPTSDLTDLGYERFVINGIADLKVNFPALNVQDHLNKFKIVNEYKLRSDIASTIGTANAAVLQQANIAATITASAMAIALG